MKRFLPTLLTAALLGSGAAHAASLSFSNANDPTPISQSGFLDLFDASIGTLQNVKLTLFGTSLSTFRLDNTNQDSRNVTASSKIDIFMSSSLTSLNLTLDALLPALSMSTSSGPLNLATGVTEIGPIASNTSLELNLDPAIFAVSGGGTFSLSCESASDQGLDGNTSGVNLSVSTKAGCGAMVVYDFIPNPVKAVSEPATLALLGIGLTGALLARRRRAAR